MNREKPNFLSSYCDDKKLGLANLKLGSRPQVLPALPPDLVHPSDGPTVAGLATPTVSHGLGAETALDRRGREVDTGESGRRHGHIGRNVLRATEREERREKRREPPEKGLNLGHLSSFGHKWPENVIC